MEIRFSASQTEELFHSAADSKDTAVDAEMIGFHPAPFFLGVVVVVARALLVGAPNKLFRLPVIQAVPAHDPLNPLLHRRVDEKRNQVGVFPGHSPRTAR